MDLGFSSVYYERVPFGDESNKDIISVLQKDNLTIGINSAGDSEDVMEYGIKRLEAFTLDILVCTSRTRGQTVRYLNSLNQMRHSSLMWIGKTYAEGEYQGQFAKANELDLAKILAAIQS